MTQSAFLLRCVWTGILLGFAGGAVTGLFFHDEAWLGGYGSWRRRMMRLGHISFFGLAFINLVLADSIPVLRPAGVAPIVIGLFVSGAISMPLVCFLSAWRKPNRHLFFVPVLSLVGGSLIFLWEVLFS